jgi:hypothetical protein
VTDDTAVELAGLLPYASVPRTPTGKPKRYGTWQSAMRDQLRGVLWERATAYTVTLRRNSREALHQDRAEDYARQYPDESRTILLALASVCNDQHEIAAGTMYAGLIADFDAWRDSLALDPFANREPSVELSMREAGKLLGVTRQRMGALLRAGRIPASKVEGEWIVARSDVESFTPRKPGRPKSKNASRA